MELVTVSSKYQVVIPRAIRSPLGIKPGQKFAVMVFDGHLHFVPVRPIKQMRGFMKGMDTTIEREPDREL